MFRSFMVAAVLLALSANTPSFAARPGEADTAFGSNGNGREIVPFAPDSAYAYASTRGPDGSIYIAGSILVAADKIDAGVARLTSEGVFDPGYGTVTFVVPGYAAAGINDLVVQPDGKLVVVGEAQTVGSGRWLICRLLADGQADTDFGDAQTPGCTTPLQGSARTVELQSDGGIVVAGTDDFGDPWRAAMVRLTQDGTLDTSFAQGDTIAVLPEELTARSNFSRMVVGADDTIVVAGMYGPAGDDQFMVAKYTADGSLRQAFSQDGVRLVQYTLLPPGERLNITSGLAVLADGSVIVSGTVYVPTNGGSMPRIGLVKIEPDGDLSPDFVSQDFPDGQLLLDVCTQECTIYSSEMALQADGRIVLVGGAEFGDLSIPTLHAIRLMPDGSPDPGFVGNNFGEFAAGVSLVNWEGFELGDMLLQGDRIVIVGSHLNAQDKKEFGAVRLLGDGVFADGLESD